VAGRSAIRTVDDTQLGGSTVTRLINVDNGGTLTDVCIVDGDGVRYTKTVTTGSSVIRVADGAITVGPDSVSAAPGPEGSGNGQDQQRPRSCMTERPRQSKRQRRRGVDDGFAGACLTAPGWRWLP